MFGRIPKHSGGEREQVLREGRTGGREEGGRRAGLGSSGAQQQPSASQLCMPWPVGSIGQATRAALGSQLAPGEGGGEGGGCSKAERKGRWFFLKHGVVNTHSARASEVHNRVTGTTGASARHAPASFAPGRLEPTSTNHQHQHQHPHPRDEGGRRTGQRRRGTD